MPWNAVKTWGAELWTVADAQQYLGDNPANIRNYLRSGQGFKHLAQTITTATTTFTHSNLCPVAPDEQSQMFVMVWAQYISTVSGSPTLFTLGIKDQGGVNIALGDPFNTPLVGFFLHHGMTTGKATVAANTNPGLAVAAKCDTGSLSLDVVILTYVRPQPT